MTINFGNLTNLFNSLLKVCLFLFFSSFLVGLLLLYTGSSAYALCGKVGLFSSTAFTLIVISEVMASDNARFTTKAIWIASFLVLQIFAGMAYYFVDRKSIYRPR